MVPGPDGPGSKRNSRGESGRVFDARGAFLAGCGCKPRASCRHCEGKRHGTSSMIAGDQLDSRSCVLIRLVDRRFALAADQVAELVAPSRIFRFAHKTAEIDGVILR